MLAFRWIVVKHRAAVTDMNWVQRWTDRQWTALRLGCSGRSLQIRLDLEGGSWVHEPRAGGGSGGSGVEVGVECKGHPR